MVRPLVRTIIHSLNFVAYMYLSIQADKPCYTAHLNFKLTLKAPITTAADDIHNFFHCFSEKIRLDVSSESSAKQRIHMANQALFSSEDKSKKVKCSLLQFLFGAFRIN